MLRHLACVLFCLSLCALPAVAADVSPKAYAPEDLRGLSERDQARVIEREYSDQSGGRTIPDDQLDFYLDQIDSGWTFSRIKSDIATSLRGNGNGNGGWNPGHGGGQGNGQVVRCESRDERASECQTGFRGRATVSRQISKTRCVEGQNWGQRPGVIWVNWGCRAEFAQMAGNGDWENSDYGNYSVTCTSTNERYATCAWNSRYGTPQLQQKLSRADCREGYSWGYRAGSVWVDKGCRARFGAVRNW